MFDDTELKNRWGEIWNDVLVVAFFSGLDQNIPGYEEKYKFVKIFKVSGSKKNT